jgi:V8-like Glu-specific endopeptidase
MTVGNHPDNPSPNGLWCSGSNVSPLNMLLTNEHCIGSQADCDDAEFVFRYYRTGCNDGSATTTDWQSFRCDQLVASSPFVSCDQGLSDLDFSLNTVVGDPAATFGWVRPDPTPLTDGEAIYIVQHPAGRPQEITHGSGSDVDVDGTVLRYYGTLDTDGGSSGSPIFRESDGLLVGLHHCGDCSSPGTGNRGMLMSDIRPLPAGFLCAPSVDLRGVGAAGLAQVTGDGDTVIEPGETWRVRPVVLDAACAEDGLGVTATLAAGGGSEAVAVAAPVVAFGTVPAGERRPATAPVAFEVSTAAACGGEVVLDLTGLTASNGGPFADAPALLRREIGETVWTTLAFSDFHLGVPAGWTVVDGGTGSGAARTWTTANPGGRTLPLGAPFAIADSRALGAQTMDEQLVSPIVATTGFATVELQFRHQFRWFGGNLDEKADVDVRSAATAGSWVNVARFSGGPASGLVTLDLTPYSAADLQVRFRYHNAINEYWWAVDDVYLRGGVPDCEVFNGLFADGFESGNTSAWSAAVP